MLKEVWHFIWEEDSLLSWVVNILLAFIIIKFLVYPGLGLALSTSHPIVAVVSSSMDHNEDFDNWWENSKDFYSKFNITKEDFADYPSKNGFNKGDIMVLRGKKPAKIEKGDIIVYWSGRPDPIIHRVIDKQQEGEVYYFQTKGDNYRSNPVQIKDPTLDETRIKEDKIVGKTVFRIPLLGYIKIGFVGIINIFR